MRILQLLKNVFSAYLLFFINKYFITNAPLCLSNDLYIGYDPETKQSFMKTIRLYKNENSYITLTPDFLYQIFN